MRHLTVVSQVHQIHLTSGPINLFFHTSSLLLCVLLVHHSPLDGGQNTYFAGILLYSLFLFLSVHLMWHQIPQAVSETSLVMNHFHLSSPRNITLVQALNNVHLANCFPLAFLDVGHLDNEKGIPLLSHSPAYLSPNHKFSLILRISQRMLFFSSFLPSFLQIFFSTQCGVGTVLNIVAVKKTAKTLILELTFRLGAVVMDRENK